MSSWTQFITPRNEIIKETINESTFAARLDEVASGRETTAPYYRDTVLFFDNTHITEGMEKLVKVASQTFLTGRCPGNNVIELQTTFGGGKTHCLVALYHLAQRPDLMTNHPSLTPLNLGNPDSNLKINTCVLVGLDYNVSKPQVVSIEGKPTPIHTWWGEIAYQLGGEKSYKEIEVNDREWTCPSKSSLNNMFNAVEGPSLILLDEIIHYLINLNKKDTSYYGVTMTFFQVLVEEVTNHRNVLLVFTLPASDLELVDKLGRKAFLTLDKLTKRHKTTIEPVQYEEVYHIIRRRLFEPLNQTQADEINRICDNFRTYYNKKKKFFPPNITKSALTKKTLSFFEKMNLGYPFHPALIDVMYQKWGPHPDFQRTRGILRIFAKILQITYTSVTSEIIMLGDVPLLEPSIKSELIGYFAENYEPVLTTDYNRACDLENSLGDDYLTLHLGKALFTGIFFHSIRLSQTGMGATKEDLCLSTLQPHIKYPALVMDMLNEMETYLFHLFETANKYYLSTRANPISMIAAEKENLSQDKVNVEDFLESYMDKAIPSAHKVTVWPENSRDIPDEARITIIAVGPKDIIPRELSKLPSTIALEIEEWIEKRGSNLREEKNGLVFVFLEETEYLSLWDNALELMAIGNVLEQSKEGKLLEKDQVKDWTEKKKGLEKSFPAKIVKAYSYLGRPSLVSSKGTSEITISLFKIDNTNPIFVKRVKEEMMKRDWLLEEIGRKLIPTNFSNFITTQDLWNRQFNVPGLELLSDKNTLVSAIQKFVKTDKNGIEKYGFGVLPKEMDFIETLKPEDFSYWALPGTQIPTGKLSVSDKAYLISEEQTNKIQSNIIPTPVDEPDETPGVSEEDTGVPGGRITGVGNDVIVTGDDTRGGDDAVAEEPDVPDTTEIKRYKIELTLDVPWNRVNDLRKLVDLCNVLGSNNNSTTGVFTLKFESQSQFSRMMMKNLEKYLEDLKTLWGENIKINSTNKS